MNNHTDLHDQLRTWATGMHPLVAATELLIRAGQATPTAPWIKTSTNGPWIDFDSIPSHIGYMSGGEQRLMLLAASLGGHEPVVLQDVISGLDRPMTDLAIAAISHAAGHHEPALAIVDGEIRRVPAHPIHPWPATDNTPSTRETPQTTRASISGAGGTSPPHPAPPTLN